MIDRFDPDRNPDVLVDRLNAGWLMIDREFDPGRKARLEDHWLALLREYETICGAADYCPEQKPDDRFFLEVRHGD